jgi:hypothetical protein
MSNFWAEKLLAISAGCLIHMQGVVAAAILA